MKIGELKKELFNENFNFAHKVALSELISKVRKESGLTQNELAKKMNTTQENIARAESGRVLPSIDFLYRVAQATGRKFKMPKII